MAGTKKQENEHMFNYGSGTNGNQQNPQHGAVAPVQQTERVDMPPQTGADVGGTMSFETYAAARKMLEKNRMRQMQQERTQAVSRQMQAGIAPQMSSVGVSSGAGNPNAQAGEEQEPAIGKLQIVEAEQILQKYKDGKKNLEQRIIENEEYWKLNHWRLMNPQHTNKNDPRPTSAWLFNSINNKHADAMDNFPEANFLPREESDKQTAKTLSSIVPVILEHCEFEATYSSAWWDKLKGGTGAYGVFWNNSMMNGLGDVDIRKIDLLNIFWEPGIERLEDSRNLFITELVDNDLLEEMFPETKDKVNGSSTLNLSKYYYDDTVDTSQKSAVIDWYYKKAGKLHYVKYVNDIVLYASENDPNYAERGYYDDGEYPVVFDVMFEEKGTPAGYGYIDIMRNPQSFIDAMDSSLVKNVALLAKPRYFVKDSSGVNEEEFSDTSKDFVHVSNGSLDDTGIKRIDVESIPTQYLEIKQNKIDELKETSGNRDFSQGATVSGVTAASAIAALQEAGSKTSRDMIKSSYRTFTKICNKVIERVRQFYDEPRSFRITGPNNQEQFVNFDNSPLQPQGAGMEFGLEIKGRLPVFDISVRAQKASPFSKIAQNELAKELYGLGVFNPDNADQAYAVLDMMDFEGKDAVMQKVQQNGLMAQKIAQMQQTMVMMANLISQSTGDTRIADALMSQLGLQVQNPQTSSRVSSGSTGSTDGSTAQEQAITNVTNEAENSTAGKARARAASAATPKV
jgi:hypothetical protein